MRQACCGERVPDARPQLAPLRSQCTSQTIPDPAFATGAHGAPLLGTVGYSWDVTTNKASDVQP